MQVDETAVSSWSPPSAGASEVICSTNVSHYELQVEIGNDPGFHIIASSLLVMKLMAQRLFYRHGFLCCHFQYKTGFLTGSAR